MTNTEPKSQFYNSLLAQAESLLADEQDLIANTANISALLFMSLEDINWAGFYFYKQRELVLGPFQGKPACIRIPMGKGVCGTSAQQQVTLVVDDVHAFAGHIACDAASNSEIVIPIVNKGILVGVLDIDSPNLNRFDEIDKQGLEKLVALLVSSME